MKRIAVAVVVLVSTPVAFALVITGPPPGVSPPSPLARTEIPPDLLPVYTSAAQTCAGLPWQVLAAVGWVESRHAHGHFDPRTGEVSPPIIGPSLGGGYGFAAIPDSNEPDGWAHALGPMQFLPATWNAWRTLAPDRPPGATPDVQNIWDAVYTASAYLCGGRQVSDLHQALLRYNHSEDYVHQVLAKAGEYGLASAPAAAPLTSTGSGEAVVAAAMTQLGVTYVWGAESPFVAFDCSGLAQWAFAQVRVAIPRTTQQQVLIGVPVSVDSLRPGDLIFSRGFENGVAVNFGHVAIYAGGGQEVVAPHSGDVVSLRPVSLADVQAIRQLLD